MELFDLYTADREKTGQTMVRGEAVPEGFYRLVVNVCIFHPDRRMLIQQRLPFKTGWSNLWDVTVGGVYVAEEQQNVAFYINYCKKRALSTSFDAKSAIFQEIDVEELLPMGSSSLQIQKT